MSVDVQYFTLCDHVVNGKTYKEQYCPKCYGKGYFLDVQFNRAGEAILTSDSIKLQQELLKILLDEQTSDIFSPYWGSELESFIGKKNTLVVRSRLEMAVRRALEKLQKLQQLEADHNTYITGEEVIASIDDIQLEAISVTEWHITITVTSVAGKSYQYELNT